MLFRSKSIEKSITETIELQDLAVKSIEKSITESLELQSSAGKSITKSLAESVGFTATTAKSVDKPVEESLEMQDLAKTDNRVSISESLELQDLATLEIKLFETLELQASPAKQFVVELQEEILLCYGEVKEVTVASTAEINSFSINGPNLFGFDYFGESVENIGDLNGDGITDMAVGAWGDDAGGSNRGAVHIMFLNNTVGSVKSDRKSTRLNSSHVRTSRMPSSA